MAKKHEPVELPEFKPTPAAASILYPWAKGALALLDEMEQAGAVRLPFPRFEETRKGLREIVTYVTHEEIEFLRAQELARQKAASRHAQKAKTAAEPRTRRHRGRR